MVSQISVVINTFNEQHNIERLINSLRWADEVVVCDMHSEDKTVDIAKSLGAKIVFCKRTQYVEPARNFAISKALSEWVLILDPDEEVTANLSEELIRIANKFKQIDYVRIPRKNIIFGKWMQASMWWPDYNIRFFRKGKVKWTGKIHRPPETAGQGLDLTADPNLAIIHRHYESISQFLERMFRYTEVEAEQLRQEGYKFDWKDLITKPLGEFLSRFFANRGFEDGLHGLTLSLLQAFSFLVVYLRLWEMEKFRFQQINLLELRQVCQKSEEEIKYWFDQGLLSRNQFKSFFQRLKNKVSF